MSEEAIVQDLIERHARKAVLIIQEQGLPDERLTPEQRNLLNNMRFILTQFYEDLRASAGRSVAESE